MLPPFTDVYVKEEESYGPFTFGPERESARADQEGMNGFTVSIVCVMESFLGSNWFGNTVSVREWSAETATTASYCAQQQQQGQSPVKS